MRKVSMTPDDAQVLYTTLNAGDPQSGLSLSAIRTILPIMDALEKHGERVSVPNGEVMDWKNPFVLELKESEYNLCTSKLEASNGWRSATAGRLVIKLIDKFKETPITEDVSDAPATK